MIKRSKSPVPADQLLRVLITIKRGYKAGSYQRSRTLSFHADEDPDMERLVEAVTGAVESAGEG